ncbi:MAG: glycoside hydrolase family 3 N-terminal domain-containing protein [Pyrinomonadaceae bacterium]
MTLVIELSIEQKVGQLFFIGLPGTELVDDSMELLTDIQPGGVCLFARNCKEARQVRTLIDEICELLPRRPFISLDQEGGLVDRLRRITEPLPSAHEVSALPAEKGAVKLATITAELIRILGFNMNFAPVVDVIDDERRGNTNGSLASRAWGNSAAEVVEHAGKYASVLLEHGIYPCLKHFPGIGGVAVDPHDDLPEVALTREELEAKDFIPYRALFASVPAVMSGHAVFPNLDLQERDSNGKLLPSSLSQRILTELLRDEFGFEGLILTDDLEMGAIVRNYGMGEAALMAFEAGSDFLLICNSPQMIREAYDAMVSAVRDGKISEDRIDASLNRIERFRSKLSGPLDFDSERISELSSEISKLKNSIGLA